MDDVQTEMIFAAQGDHEPDRGKLRFIRTRLQIRRVFAPVRLRQLARRLLHRPGQFRVYEQRQAGPRDMRQGRAELPLGDHREAVNARMNEEAFESRHTRGRQTLDMLLVVAHNSAPRHPVHTALAARGFAFCFECGNGCRRWQTVKWHVHKQRVTTGCSGACRCSESFPFRPPGFIDVDVRVHQPRQNGPSTKICYGSLRRQLILRNNIKDSPVLDEHSRRLNSVRRHHASREKCLEAQGRSLDQFLANSSRSVSQPIAIPKGPGLSLRPWSWLLSVQGLLFLALPERKNRQRLVAKKLLHGHAARGERTLQLFVNECIVESSRGGIGSQASIEDACRARPVNGSKAHRAGLARGVEVAAGKLEIAEPAASFADRYNFGVRGGIVRSCDAVGAFGYHAAVLHDQRGERAAPAGADVLESQGNGAAHEICGHDFVSLFRVPFPLPIINVPLFRVRGFANHRGTCRPSRYALELRTLTTKTTQKLRRKSASHRWTAELLSINPPTT